MVNFILCQLYHPHKSAQIKGETGIIDFPGGTAKQNLPANAGERVWILSEKILLCCRATKSVCYNLLSRVLEPSNATTESMSCSP